MYCPRCGTLMQGGICPECGFPINRARKKKTLKKDSQSPCSNIRVLTGERRRTVLCLI